jgi:hypothetical protein
MPKSRNRKNHKRAVLSFKKRVEDRRKAFEKEMRSMYEKQQQEMLAKQIQDGAVTPDQIEGGMNVGDFKLDENQETIPNVYPDVSGDKNPAVVEGVTQPPQNQ